MNANDIKNEYLSFIKDNAVFKDISENNTEVITPFVDPFGESIGFNIKSYGKSLTITDDGYTVWNLSINGIDIRKKGRRKDLFLSLLNYNGFALIDETTKSMNLAKLLIFPKSLILFKAESSP